jgi:hypothetical protein
MVCGIDLGGKRARLCFIEETEPRKPRMVRLEPTKAQMKEITYLDAARQMANYAPNIWRSMEPIVVWIEQPFGGNPRANHQLSVMAGAILSGLEREVPVEMIGAGEARKLVGIPVKATKKQIVRWATVESDADFVYDEHDADAYVIARAILAHGAKEESEEAA